MLVSLVSFLLIYANLFRFSESVSYLTAKSHIHDWTKDIGISHDDALIPHIQTISEVTLVTRCLVTEEMISNLPMIPSLTIHIQQLNSKPHPISPLALQSS